MREYYDNNPDFRAYVDKYRNLYGYSVEEALTHEMVRQAYLYYKDEEANNGTSKR